MPVYMYTQNSLSVCVCVFVCECVRNCMYTSACISSYTYTCRSLCMYVSHVAILGSVSQLSANQGVI